MRPFRHALLPSLAAALVAGCSGLLFFPMKPLVRTPADVGLDYRDVELRAADGTRLHAWWLPARGEARGTVYFLHGNAENISTHIGSVWWLPAQGYQVLLLDYRGFGGSAGVPEIPAVFADVEAGFAWLDAEPAVRGRPLFLFGQSLGAVLAGHVAASDPALKARLAGVVLDSGFTRYGTIARTVAARSWLTWPVQLPLAWSMPRDCDLLDAMPLLSPVPVLVAHGRADDTIPFHEGELLFAAAREPKQFLAHDGGHIMAFTTPANRERLLQFFRDAAAGR